MPGANETRSESEPEYSVSPWSRSAGKRIWDVCCAVLLLIALMPLMILVGIGVKFTSSGPVFFRQRRPGKNGSEFSIFKFRSMVNNKRIGGPAFTRAADPRVTWFGQYLRKWKLDELPQFFNVLAGDMSLVGPRPQPTKLWQKPSIRREAACVLSVRPGITSQATLNFRNEEELLAPLAPLSSDEAEAFYMQHIMPLKLRMDIEYLRTASFLDDLRLLLRTAFRIFHRQEDDSAVKDSLPVTLQAQFRPSMDEEKEQEYVSLTRPGD